MISVGKILRSQGKEGELRVKIYDPKLVRLPAVKKIYIKREGGMKEYRVESLSPRAQAYHLRLEGVRTLAEADSLAGAEVFLLEEDLAGLAKDEFYVHQLQGCSVFSLEGAKIGVVVDVIAEPENSLLVIEMKGKEVLVPFHASICREVNVAEKRIRIDPPEGLLELNEI